MEEQKILMTEDIEYWLLKAKSAIDQAIQEKDPLICLSPIRQAEIAIRSHVNYIQKENTESVSSSSWIIE
jgi:hypothetical protein